MEGLKVLVLGSDSRLFFLTKELIELGYSASYYSDDDSSWEKDDTPRDCIVYPLFPQIKKLRQITDLCKPGALLCAGLPSKEYVLTANEYGFSIYDYMSDPYVCMQNAVATAEGALLEAIQLSENTLQGNHVLIIGFGRCGEQLALKTKFLGALVSVYDIDSIALSHAQSLGFIATDSISNCNNYQFIFNTAPYLNLKPEILDTTANDVAIIDLASAPGGTDLVYCNKISRKAKLCSSLPARYAPKTSGVILARAIHRRLQKKD